MNRRMWKALDTLSELLGQEGSSTGHGESSVSLPRFLTLISFLAG